MLSRGESSLLVRSRRFPLLLTVSLVGCVAAAALVAAGCSGSSDLPESAGTGPDPALPAPKSSLVPVVKVA